VVASGFSGSWFNYTAITVAVVFGWRCIMGGEDIFKGGRIDDFDDEGGGNDSDGNDSDGNDDVGRDLFGEGEVGNEGEEGNIGYDMYREMSIIEPPRAVKKDPHPSNGDDPDASSVTASVDYTPDLSDMQAALAALFPARLGDQVSNAVMVGRVAPEAFLHLIQMMTIDKTMRSDPDKPLDFSAALIEAYVLAGIGLDGEGRIDLVTLLGAAKQEEAAKRDRVGGGW